MTRGDVTRASLLDTALTAFAGRGVRATTLEQVAASAALTRGAVYWHFPNKIALVMAVFEELIWPFDIVMPDDIDLCAENLLGLMSDVLLQRMYNSLSDTRQRSMMRIVVRYRGTPELPDALNTRLELMHLRGLERLTSVLDVACERGEVRRDLAPIDVAHGLIAAGVGAIAEYTSDSRVESGQILLFGARVGFVGGSRGDFGTDSRELPVGNQ